ncbi:Ig-like domain repeat protein [Flavimobilis soli]|uniref:Ig-like domain repeat protein n=1 Tax=Flavimobilis soli TaxID=442709 RepID=UPI00117B4E9C|nr:Ig-like domain repeat protein [Flavimobilis soli]
MNRTRGIAAACVVALAAVALPATATAAEVGAAAPSLAREVRATIEGELLVAVAHGPGVEKTVVSVRTDEGAIVPIDAESAPEELAHATSGAEVAVTVVVPEDVRAELRADGLSDAALASEAAADAVAEALDEAAAPVVATSATVVGEDARVDLPGDVAVGGAVAAATAAKNHSAYVAIIDDTKASGDYTEAQARATIAAGAAYWKRESGGVLQGISVKQVVKHKTADVCTTLTQGDGSGIEQVWSQVWSKYFPSQDFNRTNANHLVVFVPRGCFDGGYVGWTGMARINEDLSSGGEVMLTMSDDHTIAHELGHNFGLGHSDILRDGVEETYYGVHSVQGIAMFYDESYTTTYATPSLDVAYEWLFETVPTSAVTTGTANGTTTLSAVTASSGTKGLAFFDTKKRMYFVEYRDGSGTDASTFYNQYGYGGWQRLDSSPGIRVYELEYKFGWRVLTLGSWRGDNWHSTLQAGQSLKTRDGKMTITAQAISGGTATVKVSGSGASKTSVSTAKATHGKKTKVSVAVTGAAPALGGVTLYDGATKIGASALSSEGTATFYLPAKTAAGKHTLKAVYAGSTALAGSTGTRTITVAKAKVKAKILSAKNLKAKKKATLKIRVTGTSSTAPQGKIAVKVGSKTVSKAVKLKKSKGRWIAVVKTKKLPKGKVKVVYAPAKASKKNLTKTTVTTTKRVR